MQDKEIRNRRIIIKNVEDNELIADTKIIRYNRSLNSVIVSAQDVSIKKFCQIYAIIFGENSLYKFHGSIRGITSGNVLEVFLGKGQVKEERQAVRYPLVLEGGVEGVYMEDKEIILHKNMPIQVADMSSGGLLMKAEAGFFNIGEKYTLLLKTPANLLKMQCEIVRMEYDDVLTEKYGCRIKNVQWDDRTEIEDSYRKKTALEMPIGEYAAKRTDQETVEEQVGYPKLYQGVETFFQKSGSEPDTEMLATITQAITDTLEEAGSVLIFDCIGFSKQSKGEKHRHVLNAAFLNGIQAKWLGMDLEQVKAFIAAGLLQKVGEDIIPEENRILCERITAISNAYHMAVFAENSTNPRLPFGVLDIFYEKVHGEPDRKLVINMIKTIRSLYTNQTVIMSDGGQGIIRYIPFNDIQHPIIQRGTEIRQADRTWLCEEILKVTEKQPDSEESGEPASAT